MGTAFSTLPPQLRVDFCRTSRWLHSAHKSMEVRLPKLGEGAEFGTVVTVFVKEGDQIQKGQTILELENEKAVAPIPSPVAGKVGKLRVKEGDKLSVGQVILSVE